jgi:hypothetical protein
MHKDMYVVKLKFPEYKDFAQWLTEDVGSGVRRYQRPPGLLNAEIEEKLKHYPATVLEYCDDSAPRKFDPDDCDRIITHRDSINTHQAPNSRAVCLTNMAMPDYICLDNDGNVDLKYLKDYVNDLCNAPLEDAAWALLGMYFLSRCK